MGLLSRRREDRWSWEAGEFVRFAGMIDNFHGSRDGRGMALERGEVFYTRSEGASLIEIRQEAGHWEGSYGGISLPLPVIGSIHSGRSSSRYVPGRERPTAIDSGGVAFITSTRVAFAGNKLTREWRYKDILRVAPGKGDSFGRRAMYISVSRRQKVSALGYVKHDCEEFEFLLGLALARFLDREAEYREDLLLEAAFHYQKAPKGLVKRLEARETQQAGPGARLPQRSVYEGSPRLGTPAEVDGWVVYKPTAVTGADGTRVQFHITNDGDDPSEPYWYSYWPDTEEDTDGKYYASPQEALDSLVHWASKANLGGR